MRILAALALVDICSLAAAAPTPAIPDTPAGHTLEAWLDAFNSGDQTQFEAYAKKYDPERAVGEMVHFRQMTGGFDLLGVDKSERLKLRFRVKERGGPRTAVGNLVVKEGDPAMVIAFGLRAIPPGMSADDMDIKVDAPTRASVIDAIATKLSEFYIYPDVAKKMIAAMRAHQKKGEYDAIGDGMAFAAMLSDHLRAVSHDGHLRVECVPRTVKEEFPIDPPPPDDRMRAEMQHENCGFRKVEVLPRNIGYVKFDFFGEPSVCGPVATAAMGFVANVDAIIFDLRENGGGDPDMVSYLASYLFGARTHLNDLYERKRNKTTEYWTRPDLPGKKLVGIPAYVLTSHGTFSGAEEFTYDLKTQKRATIVGETTGGGAHPTGPQRVGDHFVLGVPLMRPINPITRVDWEGKGVEPDVKVPADKALDAAIERATKQLATLPRSGR